MRKETRYILIAASILVFALILRLYGHKIEEAIHLFSSSRLTPQQVEMKLSEDFKKAAAQLNQREHSMVNDDIRWEKAVAGPGPRLTYSYILTKFSSKDIESSSVLAKLQPEVKKLVCESKEMKPSLLDGGIYIYVYSGNDGVEITRFEIKRQDCGY